MSTQQTKATIDLIGKPEPLRADLAGFWSRRINDKDRLVYKIDDIMHKLIDQYVNKDIRYDIKSFSGIGNLCNDGTITERKGKGLLNNLPMYLRGFDKCLSYSMPSVAIVIVLDNDKRDVDDFQHQLDEIVNIIATLKSQIEVV